MEAASEGRASPPWLVGTLVLLGLAILINYIDRGNLSIAAPMIQTELHLTGTQLGLLLTSFFISYVAMQPLVGWLCDRFEAGRVLVAGFAIWSLATTFMGLAQGLTGLFALRLVLGAGESVAFPTTSKIIGANFRENRRGVANAVILTGLALGPAVGTFFGGLLMARVGWRAFFIGFGLASFVWIAAWWLFGRRGLAARPAVAGDSPRYFAILGKRSLWGSSLGHFCSNFALYFVLTWIPYYLVHARHWSIPDMAKIGGGAYLCQAATAMTSGWVADRWIGAGASPTFVRKTLLIGSALGVSAFAFGCVASGPLWSIVSLYLACAAMGVAGPHVYAAGQTLAGPSATGRWVGVQNTLANVAGIVAPALTGFLLDKTGSFFVPFAITAVVELVGAAAWAFVVGPIAQVEWSTDVAGVVALGGAVP
ncbi:MAG TPA: MFS transporter [Candidatus Acidoferrales bacterium]|nr:MFS transporter [Candidatus Acidoferrales bacterium]